MPWRSVTVMSQQLEFIMLAEKGEITFSELCRRFNISRKTGYKWLNRYQLEGAEGLRARSRRPHTVVRHIESCVEEAIVTMRRKNPTWGARKIRRLLKDTIGRGIPSCSTITSVFHRHDQMNLNNSQGRKDWQRFEHCVPNSLWQMDFKSPVKTLCGPCHPLTVLDDHSRFNLCLAAKADQKTDTVQSSLTLAFSLYGLPDAILMDNGSPWGSDTGHPYTPLGLWLLRMDIRFTHSKPYHPQTLGKDERFHRTIQQELLNSRQWQDLHHLQQAFDSWRYQYNFQRPHDALALDVPASRYKPSLRPFPEKLPPLEYPSEAYVRKVQQGGEFSFKGAPYKISKCFCGYPIGIMPTTTHGLFDILFANYTVAKMDTRTKNVLPMSPARL